MLFAFMEYNGREQLCCIDKIGIRAFPAEEFFKRDLKGLCIDSNQIGRMPETMDEFIRQYNALWTDDMALFFGSNPDLGVDLDPKKDWAPLVRPDEVWSPLQETRGRSLLE
jgi:hypothetical protein